MKAALLAILSSFTLLAASKNAGADAPTFNKNVAPILYRNCTTCHRPGEVAPFSLMNYEDAKKRSALIATVTHTRFMPPWRAEPGYGDFEDERRLSDQQIQTLNNWAKAGAPEGDPAAKPVPPQYTPGWQLGEPDMIIKMNTPFAIPAEGPDVYQCFVIPLDLPEDKYISAIEFRPGNARVTHHSIEYLDGSGAARRKAAGSPDNSYSCFGGAGVIVSGTMGGWAPGSTPRFLPEGIGKPLRKGVDLVMQNHYHPTGKPETDQSVIGVHFSKSKPEKTTGGLPLMQRGLYIPAGQKAFNVSASFTAPIDMEIIGVTPHMHLLGREMKATATKPDGTKVPIIWIRDWDFNWQGAYIYKTPLELPAGTKIDLEAVYDNSASNPRNPNNPPKQVSWGEQTTDEMAIAFLQYATAKPTDHALLFRSLVDQLDLRRFAASRTSR